MCKRKWEVIELRVKRDVIIVKVLYYYVKLYYIIYSYITFILYYNCMHITILLYYKLLLYNKVILLLLLIFLYMLLYNILLGGVRMLGLTCPTVCACLFKLRAGVLNKILSNMRGKLNLPMFLFNMGLLILMNIDSLMFLAKLWPSLPIISDSIISR